MILEKLVERLIEKIPEEYSDLEKARYLYINLAKIFTFDKDYYLGNSKMQKKLIFQANKEAIGKREIVLNRKNKAICISISKAFNYALNRVGIDASSYKANIDDPHISSKFFIDGKSYLADLQLDLMYIQMGRETRFFGKGFGNESLTDEEIRKIDNKIGYNFQGENIVSEKLKSIQEKCKSINSFSEKVELVVNELKGLELLKGMDFVETDSFYFWVFKRVLSMDDYRNIRRNFLYTKDEKGNRSEYDYYLTVLNSGNNPKRTYDRYEFDRSTNSFNKISEEIFREKIKGKNSNKNDKILGIKERKTDSKTDKNSDFGDK